jgi:hypothetical protein
MNKTITTTAAPFKSEWVIRALLDPGGVQGEPHRGTRIEWVKAFGNHGERCGETWARHGDWLKKAAEQRGIEPAYRGKFYVESVAHGERKAT